MNKSLTKRVKTLSFALTASLFVVQLSACGQKGALYLPAKEQAAEQKTEQQKQNSQQDDAEKDKS